MARAPPQTCPVPASGDGCEMQRGNIRKGETGIRGAHPAAGKTHRSASAWRRGGRRRSRPSPAAAGPRDFGWPGERASAVAPSHGEWVGGWSAGAGGCPHLSDLLPGTRVRLQLGQDCLRLFQHGVHLVPHRRLGLRRLRICRAAPRGGGGKRNPEGSERGSGRQEPEWGASTPSRGSPASPQPFLAGFSPWSVSLPELEPSHGVGVGGGR